ncbi:ragulator complex protein LAMTOR2-like [Varroa jacobsoni]|uniref:Ragulator complex protein LAMTOR2 homolog n=1 Tax=Varroa destructor TaxID=109461 RepID=A0A7M7KSU6_VARDE|nr:ragulator complex protein LAMTOR2-like [Varroa destructor]XP_022701063.1 ragulator complex protein LAMTOR2-like [Varroa jacobsoni]
MAMLRTQALVKVLSQANTGGVISTLLLNSEGVLMAYAGYAEREAKTTAALLSSVWGLNEQEGKGGLNDDRLRQVIIELEEGCVLITPVAGLLLCLCASKDVDAGMIRAKAHALTLHLEGPLLQIGNS